MIEQWRVVSRDSNFEVSSLGRVRAKERRVRCRYGFRIVPARIMKTPIGSTGYPHVSLGGRRIVSVHVLVAEAFLGSRQKGMQVNHKNANRADARLENLEWVTASENQKYRYSNCGQNGNWLGKFSGDHPTSKAVIATSITTGEERLFDSAMDAVREGFESSGISRCCTGKIALHKGYRWRFAQAYCVEHDVKLAA